MKTDFANLFKWSWLSVCVCVYGGGGVSVLKQLQNKLVYDLGATSIYITLTRAMKLCGTEQVPNA